MSSAVMVTTMMVLSGETRLLKLLHRWKLSTASRILKRCRQLAHLGGLLGVSTVRGILRNLVEPVCDLREHLAELVRILLLQLGQLIQNNGCW